MHALRLGDHLVGDDFLVEVAIGLTVSEDVADSHQQLASNGDNGLVGLLEFGKVIVVGFPVTVAADSARGVFVNRKRAHLGLIRKVSRVENTPL